MRMNRPRVLIVRAPGTNCDEEAARAWDLAGAYPETRHVNELLARPDALDEFDAFTLPGGFSHGDDLGAGRILATRLATVLGDSLRRLVERGGLVLGICNGFQVLVKAGLLPGGTTKTDVSLGGFAPIEATLTHNDAGRFESRWTRLAANPGHCPFLRGLETLELPVAHGEGKFVARPAGALAALESRGQVVLRYIDHAGRPTEVYPDNPNGSAGGVAGVCDSTGRIFGLMPHPERFVDVLQHPRWTRRERPLDEPGDGLRIFQNAVEALV